MDIGSLIGLLNPHQGYDGDEGPGELNELQDAAQAQTLRYSNFLLTFSTNVHPENNEERRAVANWLVESTRELFEDWDQFNGTVIKPAGTSNRDEVRFPDDHLIIGVRSAIAIEEGDYNGRNGQIHAHVLLEISHRYLNQTDGARGWGTDNPDKRNIGVHTNVYTMREFLNGRIHLMNLPDARQPKRIYVNSRLLTKGTDNSNKWLTYQYLNKQTAHDNGGLPDRNLGVDRSNGTEQDRRVRDRLLRRDANFGRAEHQGFDLEGVGGAIPLDDPWLHPPQMVQVPVAQPPQMIQVPVAQPPQMVQVTAPHAPPAPPTFRQVTAPRNFRN